MQNKSRKNEMYRPAEDTFFLADNIASETGKSALDVGSGSGYLTQLLSKNFDFVVGTDINLNALYTQSYKTENLVCCNGSDAILKKFDLIVCNLPYLATDKIIDIATDGGTEGFEIPKKIFDSIKNSLTYYGKFFFVSSSLSNYEKLMNYIKTSGFNVTIKDRKKLFFEELILVEAKK